MDDILGGRPFRGWTELFKADDDFEIECEGFANYDVCKD